jgi:ribosomal protein L7Ae-like RNA K-turn-binding protein
MKEVIKYLNGENLKLVIIATNLEKVEGNKGLDELVYQIIVLCRE